MEEIYREEHVSKGNKDEFAAVPLLRLEISAQNLIDFVLLSFSLLTNQVFR